MTPEANTRRQIHHNLEQDPNEVLASVLLARIRTERAQRETNKKAAWPQSQGAA